jgi:hypothetical protein
MGRQQAPHTHDGKRAEIANSRPPRSGAFAWSNIRPDDRRHSRSEEKSAAPRA